MKNAITTLRIQNFKSIKDVEIKPRRVNLILGEPNVGKSNVLEAMSLLGGMTYDQTSKFMNEMVRYEKINQLYYDSVSTNTIWVESDKGTCAMRSINGTDLNEILYLPNDSVEIAKNPIIRISTREWNDEIAWHEVFLTASRADDSALPIQVNSQRIDFGYAIVKLDGENVGNKKGFTKYSHGLREVIFVRPYFYAKKTPVGKELGVSFLYPPNGSNLKYIIQSHSNLRKDISSVFKHYGLKFSLRVISDEIEVVKEVDEITYSYPYYSIADTLQRLIFYLAAIESNDDAVLLFEEPEAHSFPTYVSQLGRRIVDSENNQFFVVTHSPYLVTEILEEMVPNDELLPQLAIFVAYYEDYQTKIRQLTDDEVRTVRANGTEMFYNLRQFTPAGQE